MDHHTSHAHALSNASGLNGLALRATLHCLLGCSIGEILGLVIATALDWPTLESIGLAAALAFAFGYGFTMVPLLRSGMPFARATGVALAADSASIALMEIVDNGIMLLIPGAMDAHLGMPLFWVSLAFALAVAGAAAYPLNRWLIARGRGHALVHATHAGHGRHAAANPSHESHDCCNA